MTERSPSPVTDTGLQEVAEAMSTLAGSADSLSRNFARGRRQFRILMITLVVLVSVFVVNVVVAVNVDAVSHTIRAQTSPAAQAANQARIGQIEQLVVGCENNHVDRMVASLTHRPLPPLSAGCPKDLLGR